MKRREYTVSFYSYLSSFGSNEKEIPNENWKPTLFRLGDTIWKRIHGVDTIIY